VLRFNFRGVGRSEGVHDDGNGEQEDARAALSELERRFPATPLVLGGFSFGSVVALRVAARDARVRAVFALGFPLVRFGDASVLQGPSQPRLFVQGERDEFGAGETLRASSSRCPPPRELVVVPEASHFFDGQLDACRTRFGMGPEAALGPALTERTTDNETARNSQISPRITPRRRA
jgi:alpha/beta superfamily hydrolase